MVSYGYKLDDSVKEKSLNPCCSGRWSRTDYENFSQQRWHCVLILVVVEDGLVLLKTSMMLGTSGTSLNPCCSGRWARTDLNFQEVLVIYCLNPYCSGRWYRTYYDTRRQCTARRVLILVVVEDGIVL